MCQARIDADCFPAVGVPSHFAGFLEIPKSDSEWLAECDRLILTLRDSGELYRMIIDGGTGRFVARQL